MPLSVRLLDDPVLRKVCEPVKVEDIPALEPLLADMYETMKAENGMGLAANQVGHSIRLFILKEKDSYREFINPEILEQMNLVDFENEGCLSIPGASANTKRYEQLTLRWLDRNGETITAVFYQMEAFAVQHEMDHLNGKLYIDSFGGLKKEMIVKKHKKFIKFRRS